MLSSSQHFQPHAGDALLVVDVQNDFLPGGTLAVPRGGEVVSVLNAYIAAFHAAGLPICLTRDWHPPDHCSFAAQGGMWPPHCIAGTRGAAFATDLAYPDDALIVSKATTSDKDAYSGFEGTELLDRLRTLGVKRVYVGGLATDYCVLNTVRDACRLGFAVLVLADAVRAVEREAGDGERAEQEMWALGALPLRLEALQLPQASP